MTTPNPENLPPCELCGGRQVGNLSVMSSHAIGLHPTGRQMWHRPLSRLSAVTCLTCGHTKLFAADLDKVRAETARRPDAFRW